MSQYEYSPAQLRYLKKMNAEKAELAKDDGTWDTPYDEPMTIAEAQEVARKVRDKWKESLVSVTVDMNGPNAASTDTPSTPECTS